MAITIIQITIIIVFFIYLIVNIVKLSKANREYNKLQTGEIEKENREEEIKKVEGKIIHAKKQIIKLIVFAIIVLCYSKIIDLTRGTKPIRIDN